jgi:ADP-dependent NAD(P)H-hydrate dehydratase / NAD(P)H-hydrate epimerase
MEAQLAGALENKNAVLTPDEMARADKLAVQGGMSGARLMENAGQAVKSVVLARYPCICRALVLCGPGNNGGDGYAAARLLSALGIETLVFRSRAPKPGTDAEAAATAWNGPVLPLSELRPEDGDVVIDALYGAGFSGALDGDDARAAETVRHSAAPVISVDLPSGVSGLTGICGGVAFQAAHTVTFFRKKPGHLLYPGRGLCGRLHVADIGIPSGVLDAIAPALWENSPVLFSPLLPRTDPVTHKYARGHAGIFSGGPASTGAAQLAAMAAARAGAGAVTVFAPGDALPALAAHLTSVMLKKTNDASGLAATLAGPRLGALVIGPGFGRYEWLREIVGQALKSGVERRLVLDADVFSAFASDPETLFGLIKASASQVVLTPHEGEFQRLFPGIFKIGLGKHNKAREAAELSCAVVLYKGPDTVIASPDGRAAINTNGGPELATAGSGDVLAGITAGLLAQGMPAFEAACAGAWMHGEAGKAAGRGAVAEDFVAALGPRIAQTF